MKLFSGMFFGVVFLAVGIVLLFSSIFNFNINAFKLIVGVIIILFGVSVFFYGFGYEDSRNIIFREGTVRLSKVQDEYNIIFGSGTIDLSKVEIGNKKNTIRINTIFGEGKVIINPKIPTVINASSAFGSLELPDNSSVVFGSRKYETAEITGNQGYLEIIASAVFGRMEFKNTSSK